MGSKLIFNCLWLGLFDGGGLGGTRWPADLQKHLFSSFVWVLVLGGTPDFNCRVFLVDWEEWHLDGFLYLISMKSNDLVEHRFLICWQLIENFNLIINRDAHSLSLSLNSVGHFS